MQVWSFSCTLVVIRKLLIHYCYRKLYFLTLKNLNKLCSLCSLKILIKYIHKNLKKYVFVWLLIEKREKGLSEIEDKDQEDWECNFAFLIYFDCFLADYLYCIKENESVCLLFKLVKIIRLIQTRTRIIHVYTR